MEVHAHTHTARKKWTHYLWEFLMLFLAVFCGFLAENFRENQVEHQREKQFIVSMIKELESDTSGMNEVLQDTVRIKGIDSLLNILYDVNIKTIDTGMVYYLRGKYTFNVDVLRFNRNTLTQLKYGGNMRLISNQHVVDSLNKLDNSITQAESQFAFSTEVYHLITPIEADIFNDGFYLKDRKLMPSEFILKREAQPVFLTSDNRNIIQYANMIRRWRGALNSYQRIIGYINKYSATLIPYLKKEYHLK